MWIPGIRTLAEPQWLELFRILIPWDCFAQFHIEPETFQDPHGRLRLRVLYRNRGRVLNVRITDPDDPMDPIYSIFLGEYGDDGVDAIGININDPRSRRFEVDLDQFGRIPADQFSGRRNVKEEIEAMKAGLAPGQVKKGLRWFGEALAGLEAFLKRLNKRFIHCEAMAYHNAMIYERHGFGYEFRTFRDEMSWIDREFRAPSGILYKRLDGSSAFRQRGYERTVRGRSWAIHDGIMGRPWAKPLMVKEVEIHAGVNTFPDGVY
jgi:hypothetical protein